MKIRKKSSTGDDKVEVQMTPMIDIVFLLLVFFVMTFKIVAQEADFNIRMPAFAAPSEAIEEPEIQTLRVRMQADANGELALLKLDGANCPPHESDNRRATELHARIRGRIEDSGGPSEAGQLMEVEFDCDYNLKYNYVIEAITAVSGYKVGNKNNKKVVKLIEKIKFTAPKPQ